MQAINSSSLIKSKYVTSQVNITVCQVDPYVLSGKAGWESIILISIYSQRFRLINGSSTMIDLFGKKDCKLITLFVNTKK